MVNFETAMAELRGAVIEIFYERRFDIVGFRKKKNMLAGIRDSWGLVYFYSPGANVIVLFIIPCPHCQSIIIVVMVQYWCLNCFPAIVVSPLRRVFTAGNS